MVRRGGRLYMSPCWRAALRMARAHTRTTDASAAAQAHHRRMSQAARPEIHRTVDAPLPPMRHCPPPPNFQYPSRPYSSFANGGTPARHLSGSFVGCPNLFSLTVNAAWHFAHFYQNAETETGNSKVPLDPEHL